MKLTITGTSVGDGGLLRDMAHRRTMRAFMQAILDKKAEFMPWDLTVYDNGKKHVIINGGVMGTRGEEYIERMDDMPFEGGDVEISADYGLKEMTVWIYREKGTA